MTPDEREAIARVISAINSLTAALDLLANRLTASELALVGMHKRLRMLETGESEIQLPVRAH